MTKLAIEFISALAMPPARFVGQARALGIDLISMGLTPVTDNPYGFEPWDLSRDPSAVKATKRALNEHGVQISMVEGFVILPGLEIAASQSGLDIATELEAPCVNCLVFEQDRSRARDQFAELAALAADRGLGLTLEFMPLMWPMTLDETATLVTASGAANAKLMIDAMHFFRSGASVADLGRIDAAQIGYIQICDVPMPAKHFDYAEEARNNRLCPGEGDLPLADFLAALPRDLVVGLEVPLLTKAQAGESIESLLGPCIDAARSLLANVH